MFASGLVHPPVFPNQPLVLQRHSHLVMALLGGDKAGNEMERVKGIEPSYSAWKAAALPLSYTRAGVDLTRRADGLNPPRKAPVLS